jgi:hypothetical protein
MGEKHAANTPLGDWRDRPSRNGCRCDPNLARLPRAVRRWVTTSRPTGSATRDAALAPKAIKREDLPGIQAQVAPDFGDRITIGPCGPYPMEVEFPTPNEKS